jgi:hypothetical protein
LAVYRLSGVEHRIPFGESTTFFQMYRVSPVQPFKKNRFSIRCRFFPFHAGIIASLGFLNKSSEGNNLIAVPVSRGKTTENSLMNQNKINP